MDEILSESINMAMRALSDMVLPHWCSMVHYMAFATVFLFVVKDTRFAETLLERNELIDFETVSQPPLL